MSFHPYLVRRFRALTVNEGKDIRLEVADGFYLSPIVRADKAAYLEHFADPEIAHNLLAIPFPYTEADADWWLDRCEQSIGSPMTNFALRAPSGYLIGAIGVVGALSPDASSLKLGPRLTRKEISHGGVLWRNTLNLCRNGDFIGKWPPKNLLLLAESIGLSISIGQEI